MATLAQLEAALVAADKAGDMDGARKLAAAVVKAKARPGSDIPGAEVPGTVAQPAEPGVLDKIVGAGEAALSVGTGMVGAPLGMGAGFISQIIDEAKAGKFGTKEAADRIEQAMMSGAQSLTYAPRTQSGQEQTQAVGEVMGQLLPIAPLAGTMPSAAGAARAALPVAANITRAAVPPVVQAVQRGAAGVMERVAPAGEASPTPGTMGSAGAAATDLALQRRATAASLPEPIKLTQGQATRSFEQQRFERETAKDPTLGAPIRERYAQQNEGILRNFDAFIDQTGAEAPSLRAVGAVVDKALVDQAKADKARVRVAYKEAEKAGEMQSPVTLEGVVQHLNEAAPEAATAPLLTVARNLAIKLGIAAEDADGQLVPQPVTLKHSELYRQALNRATDYEPTNVRQSAIIKGLVDDATKDLGGENYAYARKLRARYAQNYENRATVAKLLDTKRGTSDRQVAFEDVFDHTILRGSLDDVRNVRRVLQRGADDGQQAWRELQGATLNWVKDQATKNVATDVRGNPIVSASGLDKAIRTLDHDGKLDFVFGKQGAQQMRDLNELSKVIYTAPPGSVNTSNTASVLLAALAEAGAWGGATGLPVPVLTGLKQLAVYAKDRKIAARVNQALAEAKRRGAPAQANQP